MRMHCQATKRLLQRCSIKNKKRKSKQRHAKEKQNTKSKSAVAIPTCTRRDDLDHDVFLLLLSVANSAVVQVPALRRYIAHHGMENAHKLLRTDAPLHIHLATA